MKWTRPLPTKLPARIHAFYGPGGTNWTGELRAVVDDEQLVIRRWSASKRRWIYFIEWRYTWEQGWLKAGPLPRETEKHASPG